MVTLWQCMIDFFDKSGTDSAIPDTVTLSPIGGCKTALFFMQ